MSTKLDTAALRRNWLGHVSRGGKLTFKQFVSRAELRAAKLRARLKKMGIQ